MLKSNYYYLWSVILFLMSIMYMYISFILMYNGSVYFFEYNLYFYNSISLCYLMLFDWISMSFVSVVFFISSMVLFYSMQYMGYMTYSSIRFLFLVLLFVFSMFLMIMSPNLVSILLGWDGLGLVSYCLVIYYSSNKSYLAGMITCLTNRLGDVGLLISICWMISYGSWHFMFYSSFFSQYLYLSVIMSCFTKSAQIPFSCWLPAAMAAPTPVSALVHSSTLVTAGVYLLIRFYNYFNLNIYLVFISLITMLMSSVCALFEYDLSKIIALSTLSQLGLMMTSLFLGMSELSYFHLITHAMFKSLLFLCAGIFIYYMNDTQDIRSMSLVCLNLPFTTSCFNISSLSLCGMPFLSGFYSKDLIIENSLFNSMNLFIFIMFYISLGLTAGYSLRLFYYTMIYINNYSPLSLFNDNFDYMKFSVFLLTMFSVMIGCLIVWIMNFDLLFLLFPVYIKMLVLFIIMLGMWVSYESFFFNYLFFISFYLFNNYMWFMYSHSMYTYFMFYYISINSMNNVLSWGEYYGASGLSFYILKFSNYFQLYFSSSLKIFLLMIIFWLIILI
uniref:NADH-ubiquinone oxidoreductase chain 5 n=1 Tax=Sahlbergotettix salicicola TaxID=2937677 RepID=A0A9E9FYV7_9HEMI|nr:NADH dehydrogenase subunit 5 [Sahlbergotettix salicicola]WAP91678.1 NADH dehydrogenase subunit 5 [Sahlbergotettix salicicola]